MLALAFMCAFPGAAQQATGPVQVLTNSVENDPIAFDVSPAAAPDGAATRAGWFLQQAGPAAKAAATDGCSSAERQRRAVDFPRP